MRYIPDPTGRFARRPYFADGELDRECERLVAALLRDRPGPTRAHLTTEDLQVLVEDEAEDLDCYADLSAHGPEVEGVTEFRRGRRPSVAISVTLTEDRRRENRLRTTLAHEYGHVHFHAHLLDLEPATGDLLADRTGAVKIVCKRDRMLDAPGADWIEWQAGYVSGAVLMPISDVRRLVGAYQERHGLFGPVLEDGPHGRALTGAVAETFRTSGEAARVRLAKLGILGPEPYERSLFD